VSITFSLLYIKALDALDTLVLVAEATLDAISTWTGAGNTMSWIIRALAWPELNVVFAGVFTLGVLAAVGVGLHAFLAGGGFDGETSLDSAAGVDKIIGNDFDCLVSVLGVVVVLMDELVSVVSLKPSPSSSTEALLYNDDSPKESVGFFLH